MSIQKPDSDRTHAEHQPLKEINREPPPAPAPSDKPQSRIVAGDDPQIGRKDRGEKPKPMAKPE